MSDKRLCRSKIDGAIIGEYRGFGRPPIYTPEQRKAREKAARKARYEARKSQRLAERAAA